jgi:hypothetical protein
LVPNSLLPSAPPTAPCRARPCAATVTCGRPTQPVRAPVVTTDRRPKRSNTLHPHALLRLSRLRPRPPRRIRLAAWRRYPSQKSSDAHNTLAPDCPASVQTDPSPSDVVLLVATVATRAGACAGRQSVFLSSPSSPFCSLAARTPRHGIHGPAYCGTRARLHGLDRRASERWANGTASPV